MLTRARRHEMVQVIMVEQNNGRASTFTIRREKRTITLINVKGRTRTRNQENEAGVAQMVESCKGMGCTAPLENHAHGCTDFCGESSGRLCVRAVNDVSTFATLAWCSQAHDPVISLPPVRRSEHEVCCVPDRPRLTLQPPST